MGILTSDRQIGEDASILFNMLSGYASALGCWIFPSRAGMCSSTGWTRADRTWHHREALYEPTVAKPAPLPLRQQIVGEVNVVIEGLAD